MKRCVIVSGAEINDYTAVKKYLKEDDYNVFCDCGSRHAESLGIEAHLIVGDFDSHERPKTDTETIVLPCEKDDTDTVYAVNEALKRGFDSFLIVGAVGQRFDHTFGNISILLMLDTLGKKAVIVDDYSEMEIISREPKTVESGYSYFSLLNVSGLSRGVTIKNAKYNIEDAEITSDCQYGISNETVGDIPAEISVKEGRLLLVKVR